MPQDILYKQLVWCVLQEVAITEGPPILAAGMSLDGSLLALQRSSVRLEFVSCKTQNIFVQVRALLPMPRVATLTPLLLLPDS